MSMESVCFLAMSVVVFHSKKGYIVVGKIRDDRHVTSPGYELTHILWMLEGFFEVDTLNHQGDRGHTLRGEILAT